MSLKKKIDSTVYNTLSTELKSCYTERDGSYILDLDVDDDAAALKRAKDREKEQRKTAEARVKELEDKLAELTGNDARKNGDIATLEKAWKDKLDKEVSDRDNKLNARNRYIETLLVDKTAASIAAEISTAPELLLPHIRMRLKADLDADTPTTVVLSPNGEITRFTVEDLKKEIVGDRRFASVIIGSKASGSQAPSSHAGNDGRAGSAHGSSDRQPVDLNKLSPAEIGRRFAPKGYTKS